MVFSANLTKPARQSGIELLRIIAAMMVVFCHLSSLFVNRVVGVNLLITNILSSITVCAVNIFVLISGYFLSHNQKRTIGKPINLIILMVLFSLGSFFLQLMMGRVSFEASLLAKYLFPFNYFVTLYIVLYIVSPYLNLCIEQLNGSSWIAFLVISVCAFSLYPILIDILEETLSVSLSGASSISRTGSQNGYNVVTFFLLYSIGAFLRANEQKLPKQRIVWFILLLISVALIFLWSHLGHFVSGYSNSSHSYHNPVVILSAVSFFMLFKSFSFVSSVVNMLSKAAFSAFLLHTHLFPFLYWQFHIQLPCFLFFIWILVVLILIYIISWLIWRLYDWIFGPVIRQLDQISISYFL